MLSTPRFNAETKEFSPVEDVMDPGPNDSMCQPDIVKAVTSQAYTRENKYSLCSDICRL
jgi:hypothetical protein